MNTNLIHNILNLLQLIVGALLTFDWTVFGASPQQALAIGGGVALVANIIKLGMNITRDGVSGLVKKQPPVTK